jgi:hypothetical protein
MQLQYCRSDLWRTRWMYAMEIMLDVLFLLRCERGHTRMWKKKTKKNGVLGEVKLMPDNTREACYQWQVATSTITIRWVLQVCSLDGQAHPCASERCERLNSTVGFPD